MHAFASDDTIIEFSISRVNEAISKGGEEADEGTDYNHGYGKALIGRMAGSIVGETRNEGLEYEDGAGR